MSRRPTILDVAAHAGLSKSTVSLVLKNSPLIKAETAATVRASMAAVGYVYNRSAAKLRSASGGLIGLIINDLTNPFFTEFATSFQMALFRRGYATVISNSAEDAAIQAQIVRSMLEHGVSALVMSPAYGDVAATFEQIEWSGVPTLQVLRMVNERTDQVPFYSFDYSNGSLQATRHLIEAGSRRIAFVGGLPGRPITAERMSGYLSEMVRIGVPPIVLPGGPSRKAGAELGRQLLLEHPDVDAVICFNDYIALGLLTSMISEGRTPGRDIRIVGFDDIEESAQIVPSLSSISCDIRSFGESTARVLLDWLTKGRKPDPVCREPVRLIARDSSAP